MLEPILRQSKSFPIVRLTNLQGEKIRMLGTPG